MIPYKQKHVWSQKSHESTLIDQPKTYRIFMLDYMNGLYFLTNLVTSLIYTQ